MKIRSQNHLLFLTIYNPQKYGEWYRNCDYKKERIEMKGIV